MARLKPRCVHHLVEILCWQSFELFCGFFCASCPLRSGPAGSSRSGGCAMPRSAGWQGIPIAYSGVAGITRASNASGKLPPRARVRELAAKEAATESIFSTRAAEGELGKIEVDLVRERKRKVRVEPAVGNERRADRDHRVVEKFVKGFLETEDLCEPVECPPVKPDKNRGDGGDG